MEYGTTRAQMQEILAGFERVLRAHPKIWPDTVVVRFVRRDRFRDPAGRLVEHESPPIA